MEGTVQYSTEDTVHSKEDELCTDTIPDNNAVTQVGSLDNGNKRRKISEGVDKMNQGCLIGDLATHSDGAGAISEKIHCTAVQMGQVEQNSGGGLLAETGLVNKINPEVKTFDPNMKRTQIKISDLFIIKTHCTQIDPSFRAQGEISEVLTKNH